MMMWRGSRHMSVSLQETSTLGILPLGHRLTNPSEVEGNCYSFTIHCHWSCVLTYCLAIKPSTFSRIIVVPWFSCLSLECSSYLLRDSPCLEFRCFVACVRRSSLRIGSCKGEPNHRRDVELMCCGNSSEWCVQRDREVLLRCWDWPTTEGDQMVPWPHW